MTSKPMQDHSPPGSGRWIETARHIFALSGLAIVQHLLDLISSNPQFLVAQGLGTVGILLFPFALTFLLPGILSLLPLYSPLYSALCIPPTTHINILSCGCHGRLDETSYTLHGPGCATDPDPSTLRALE